MNLKNILVYIVIILSLLVTGCDSEIIEKLKVKIGLSQDEEILSKSQSDISQNDCNDEEYKQLVLEMIQEALAKQTGVSKEEFNIEPTYTMLSTEVKTDLKTSCSARIVYKYPKEIENASNTKLDVEYMITKNELMDKGYIVTLFKTNLNELIDFQSSYSTMKEDYLFEKLQVKKIKTDFGSKTPQIVLFSVYKDSLKLNDWNEDLKSNLCKHDSSTESTQCSYKFLKKSYVVTVNTKRQDECFFCSKKNEFVHSTHIYDQ